VNYRGTRFWHTAIWWDKHPAIDWFRCGRVLKWAGCKMDPNGKSSFHIVFYGMFLRRGVATESLRDVWSSRPCLVQQVAQAVGGPESDGWAQVKILRNTHLGLILSSVQLLFTNFWVVSLSWLVPPIFWAPPNPAGYHLIPYTVISVDIPHFLGKPLKLFVQGFVWGVWPLPQSLEAWSVAWRMYRAPQKDRHVFL